MAGYIEKMGHIYRVVMVALMNGWVCQTTEIDGCKHYVMQIKGDMDPIFRHDLLHLGWRISYAGGWFSAHFNQILEPSARYVIRNITITRETKCEPTTVSG
jgi:hypothetical protein